MLAFRSLPKCDIPTVGERLNKHNFWSRCPIKEWLVASDSLLDFGQSKSTSYQSELSS